MGISQPIALTGITFVSLKSKSKQNFSNSLVASIKALYSSLEKRKESKSRHSERKLVC